ncbi:putative tpa [Lasiodiplodia theobromae]|uniref:GPI anchored protein n=1 Tax=Lasiodiplodia theobromae TaxID=45133 RepID=UPI0015C40ACC|nr:GPI anchored protein [Lasiodiplodia theobromae]KAF4546486.1 GPI anchored protein [Lasiodiplodia theobromae]KAF9631898.1 putative tpa [Lasiodiplodia theobromae]
MISPRLTVALLAGCALQQLAAGAEVHGAGAEGTVMGPVAFLWPSDRQWDASQDNTAPCGSSAGVTNRTEFPLDQGSVALTIADDAWNVEFHLAVGNNPTSESDFTEQVVSNISSVQPGHQCYKLEDLPDTLSAGTNATIQLEYWSSYEDGKNETFYACADITFVEAVAFDAQVPCFNVTASDFNSGSASSSASSSTASATGASASSSSNDNSGSSSSSGGLSTSDKAGIAIGSILGGLSIIGAGIFFFLYRRRAAAKREAAAAAAAVTPKEVEEASVRSARH